MPCYCNSHDPDRHSPYCYWRREGSLTVLESKQVYEAAKEEVAKYTVRSNAPKILRAFIEVWERV